MAATIRTYNSNYDDSGSGPTTLDVVLTGVTAGDTVVAFVKHEGATTTISVADTGSTDVFTGGTKTNHSSGDMSGQMFYLLSATVTGTVTYRATFGAGRNYCRIGVYVINPGGKTAALSAETSAYGTGTSGNSGGISPTGTDLVVFGGFGEYTSDAPDTLTIDSTAADGSQNLATYGRMWYRILTTGFTSGTAAFTGYSGPGTNDWVCCIMAMSFSGGGGGGGGAGSVSYLDNIFNRTFRPRPYGPGRGR